MTGNLPDCNTESDNYKARFDLIRLLLGAIIFNSLIILAIPWFFGELQLRSFSFWHDDLARQLVFMLAAIIISTIALKLRKFYQLSASEDPESAESWQNRLKAGLFPYVLLEAQIVLAILGLLVFGDLLTYLVLGSSALFLMIRLWPVYMHSTKP